MNNKERDEQSYMEGKRAVYRSLLGDCLRELTDDAETATELAKQTAALCDAEVQLRNVYQEIGEDYPDGLYLADAIGLLGKMVSQ